MQIFTGASFLGAILALSSAAAINRHTTSLTTPALVPRVSSGSGGRLLKPINLDTFKSALNLHVRDAVDFSRLDLAFQAELIFGAPGENGNILLANMTLHAPDGQQMVMMESFEGLTSAVDCEGDDGSMSLTFVSKDAFDAAVEKWSVVNENDEDSFLLIANHDGCGLEDQRQAYTISKVSNNEVTLATTLTAKAAPWSEIAGTFDMNFGSAIVAPGATRRLLARGLWDDIKNTAGDMVDKAKDMVDGAKDIAGDIVDGAGDVVDTIKDGVEDVVGDVNDAIDGADAQLDKEITFDVTIGQPGQRFNVLTDTVSASPAIVVDCVDCFITGKFKVAGTLSVDNFQVQELILSASPQDFQSKLELEATLSASASIDLPSMLSLSTEVASFPIPGAGIVVPGIFELGTILSYEVAVDSSIAGTANFTFGVMATFPNTAGIVLNIADLDSSSASGFESATFDPFFEMNSGSASLHIAVVSRPKLTFGVEVVGVGKLEAALKLGLPKVSAAFTAGFYEAGFCEQTAGVSKTGIRVASNATLGLDLTVDGKFGPGGILDAGTLVEVNLLKFEQPLFDKCFPINIPGLEPTMATALSHRAIGY